MSTKQSPCDSSSDEYEEDAPLHGDSQHQQEGEHSAPISGNDAPSTGSPPRVAAVPLQKRRRVTRACDECRRKKIKCDGKQPCTHCTVYSYECSYDQPSNRRRNPAPQYVESLEIKLHRAENVLRAHMPEISLDDPALDIGIPSRIPPYVNQEGQSAPPQLASQEHRPQQGSEGEKDSMLESMVENTGTLDLDDDGYWDFHGHSSGRAFLRKMRDQFGDLMGEPDAYSMPLMKSKPVSQTTNSPSSALHSPMGSKPPTTRHLPAKRCAQLLCENALDDACAILRFVHQPTFYTMLDRIYEVPQESLTSDDLRFLPLLYSAIALGSLFATAEQSQLMTNGFANAIEQGSHWYKTARSMMDITDCRDLTSLQTVLFMIMFLQSSAKLSNCYSHLGILLRSSVRMGLHRTVLHKFNPIEQETRRRIFWCVRKLDIYVGALLGLPQMLDDDDVDQEQPVEVDDEYITLDAISLMPPGQLSLMTAFNAHTRIVDILAKTVRYIYPIKGNRSNKQHSYVVSHAKIREIEQDIQAWMEGLPAPFKPGAEAPKHFIRIQHLLRMAYAHIEMFLYRPFLHYVSQDVQAKSFNKRSYACAAACISVSRNIIHLTGEMKKRGLLVGSYWFYMYTTFFSIISLVFFVLENPHSATSTDILKDAHEGKDILAGLASRSLAADRCSKHLADLFDQLPEKLKDAKMHAANHKKRQVRSQPAGKKREERAGACDTASKGSSQARVSPIHKGPRQREPSTFQSLNPAIDTTYRFDSQNSFSPPAGRLMHGPQSPKNTIYPHAPIGHGIPDLSAMMFPSSDPFAYPNQPMTTLENQHYIKQETPTNQSMFSPPVSGSFEGMSGEVYGGVPTYPMPSPSQQGGFPISSPDGINVSGVDSGRPLATPAASQNWSQYQQAPRGTSNMPFDQLFGEDWGGWMNQGYRQ